MTIYFLSPLGAAPLTDKILQDMLVFSAGWRPDGVQWVYGAAKIMDKIHIQEVVSRMKYLGILVLPDIRHPKQPKVNSDIIKTLEIWGVKINDTAHDVVEKMAAASGNPALAPDCWDGN